MRATRDILYVCGETVSGDTLHVFVVHQPSKFGGETYTRPFRKLVADRVCQSVDSIYAVSPNAKLLIAGDFNDAAGGYSLQPYYQHGLQNITKDAQGSNGVKGTYRYKGEWESIDHVLASPYIYNKVSSASIHSPLFILEDESQYGGYRPRRTYNGMRYQPGYSDHLPLIVRFTF
jgi:endonuclease/exonuclease/phosphatase family metal-dependent hydrolase